MKTTHAFTKDGVTHRTENLSEFCREKGLQRRHMHEVSTGLRQSHHGWSLEVAHAEKPDTTEDDGSMTVEQVLQMAEIAARSSGDKDSEKLVTERTAKIRRSEPLPVTVLDD